MKVTEIKKRRGHLVEVRFDDGTYILLDSEYAVQKDYAVGKTVDDDTADHDECASDLLRAKNRAYYYLTGGDYSEKGLSEKLKKAGFPESAVRQAVERTVELGLVDNIRFKQRFVERCREQNLSVRDTVEKLVQKGIPRDEAKLAAECDSEDEVARIVSLLKRKYAGKLDDEDAVRKTVASLMRKGFSIYDIKSALKQWQKDETNE